jgi:two-component system nitrogen regulation sensor histidine kinase NtrY
MTEQQLLQALLPFYTTKSQGTGVGLALCNEIVIAHGGRLKLENQKGGGLRVAFSLSFALD